MSINTPSPMISNCSNKMFLLKVVISTCLASSMVSWYASKWVYNQPINISNSYLVSAITTTLVIIVNYIVVKQLLAYRRRLQRLEAYFLTPVTSAEGSANEPCSTTMRRRGYAALHDPPWFVWVWCKSRVCMVVTTIVGTLKFILQYKKLRICDDVGWW